jgi:NADP-dependent aldehyde dehydrogenase
MGAGQFCTNPGLIFLPDGHGDAFLAKLCSLVNAGSPAVMLNAGICAAYQVATSDFAAVPGVTTLAAAADAEDRAVPVVFSTDVETFLADERLHGEMFGPAALIVRGSVAEIQAAIAHLEGQLTGSVHATEGEITAHAGLLGTLERRVGRLIFNGFPTGVEVCHSMVHGGPYPSTSDGRSTSVGSMAIFRFCRAIAWQSFPQSLLPTELRDGNPLNLFRMVDGLRGRH